MKNLFAYSAIALGIAALSACRSTPTQDAGAQQTEIPRSNPDMELGNFSVSLAVKDLAASREFYEKLGFTVIGGDPAQNWLILRNGDCIIGLFQGMFEHNTLTFNPGWAQGGEPVDPFTDVREIQRRLKQRGLTLAAEADESTTGPAYIMLIDPDGNPILIDQHR